MITKIKKEDIYYYLMLAMGCALFSGYRFTNIMLDWIGFERILNFDYHRPFVGRVLIPSIAKLINSFGLSPELTFNLLEVIGCILAVIFFKKYLNLFIQNERTSRLLSYSLLLVLPYQLLLPRLINTWYCYDIYSVFFVSALLYYLVQEKFLWFYLLYILAVFNRETPAFISILMAITFFNKMPLKKLALHGLLQVSIFFAVRGIIEHLILKGTPGGVYEDNLAHNIGFFKQTFNGIFNGRLNKSLFDLLYLLTTFWVLPYFVIPFRKHIKNEFLSKSMLVFIPYGVIVFFIGMMPEIRFYSEMTPIFLAPALVIIVDLIRDSKKEEN